MNNLFTTDLIINQKYDLKGSTYDRYTHIKNSTRKDNNFL